MNHADAKSTKKRLQAPSAKRGDGLVDTLADTRHWLQSCRRAGLVRLVALALLAGCEDVSLNLGPPERPPPLRPAGGALRRSVTQPATTPAAEPP